MSNIKEKYVWYYVLKGTKPKEISKIINLLLNKVLNNL